MKKFRMILWYEGLLESELLEKELEVSTCKEAFKEVEENIEKTKQEFPLFDFGLFKLMRIQNGEEIEIPLPAL